MISSYGDGGSRTRVPFRITFALLTGKAKRSFNDNMSTTLVLNSTVVQSTFLSKLYRMYIQLRKLNSKSHSNAIKRPTALLTKVNRRRIASSDTQ